MFHHRNIILTTLICTLALTSNLLASEDNVDYDHSADFSQFHTYKMADTSKGALAQADQLMDQRVHGLIVQHLNTLGLKEVAENPDLTVTYDASTMEHHVLNTVGAPMGPVGVRFGMGWRRFGGMGMATTTESTFTDGTLVIDVYVPATKKMILRGTAEAAVSKNPETTTKHIEKSLDKLFKKWQKITEK